jgi:glycosyltransferase involved in cell wall biosynthesis
MIDIMMPFWGDPGQLRQAVASVRAQSWPDWRLTVIDDAYPDRAPGRAVQAIDDPRVRYLRNEANLGITGNFRRSVELARADWLTVMGCDDLLAPNYVATVARAVQHYPQADIVQVGVQAVDQEGRPRTGLVDWVKLSLLAPRGPAPTVLAGQAAAISLLRGDWLYWPSLAFRRESVKRFDFRDEFPVIQDLALIVDMVLGGATLVYYPQIAFRYRRHGGSASQRAAAAGDRFTSQARYYRLAADLMEGAGWERAARIAHRRVTSRVHAATGLPRALTQREWRVAGLLARHVIERDPRA